MNGRPRRPNRPEAPCSTHRPAVPPHRLHCAVAPPVALPPELAERVGRLGAGDRGLLVDDPPTGPVYRHRQVGVLGEGGPAEPARLADGLPAEAAQRARDGRHAVQRVVEAAVEVEPDHVLDVLPAADDPPPVADLDVAGDRAHRGVGERLHQLVDRVRRDHRVRVDHHQQVVPGQRDAGVERGRLAAAGHPDHPHVGQAERLHLLGRAVVGLVVDDQHLDARMGAGGQGCARRRRWSAARCRPGTITVTGSFTSGTPRPGPRRGAAGVAQGETEEHQGARERQRSRPAPAGTRAAGWCRRRP